MNRSNPNTFPPTEPLHASDPHNDISPLARSLMTPETSALSSRDPIRMYLSQMGNIPLLSRDREIFLAKQIEITRKRFRRTVLQSDFALTEAVAILEKVHAGKNFPSNARCGRPKPRMCRKSKFSVACRTTSKR